MTGSVAGFEAKGRLANKVALITGAAQGISAAHGRVFARAGARVVLADVQRDKVEALAAEIRADGGEASTIQLDVADATSWAEAISFVDQEHGSLTSLINNAALYWLAGLEDESEAGWDRMIATNQKGAFLVMRTAMPMLKASGHGSIVNISSILGIVGSYPCLAYHAAKGALRTMGKAVAIECAATGVRVNTIFPGNIITPILDQLSAADMESIRLSIPMQRSGKAEDVALASLFLCSDDAAYITGAELSVDGGLGAM